MMQWPVTVSGIEALLEERRREEEVIRVEFEARVSGVRQDVIALERSLALARAKLAAGEALDDADVCEVAAAPGSEPMPAVPATPEAPTINWRRELDGLSQLGAAIRVAELNGGTIRPSDAKPIFLAAGLIKGNPKYANQRITSVLIECDRLERVAPGAYRLVEAPGPVGGNMADVDLGPI